MNLFDLFARINLDSSEYEAGLENAEKSTASFGSKLKTGLSNAAKAATVAVGAVSAAGTALAGAMVSGASELAQYGDNIDKMSQKMGLSAEAYQEWDAIMQHSGASIESLLVSMKTMSSAAESGNDAFEKLGITQEEMASLNQEDLFERVISGLQEMETGTERTYIASQLLGRGATELGALLNTSAEDTEAMRRRVHELGGVLSNEAVKGSAKFQDNLQDLKTAFSGIKRGIASDMLPGLNSLMEGFTSLLVGEEGAEEAIKSGFDSVLENVNSGIGKALSIGKGVLPTLVKSIVEGLPELATSVLDLFTLLGETITENTPALIEAALSIIQRIGEGIAENLPIFAETLTQVISEIALMLSNPDTLAMFLSTVLLILETITSSILENIPLLVDTTMQVLDNIVTFIIDNLPMFLNTAVSIIMALVDGFVQALPDLLNYLPTIIDNITTTLLAMLPLLVDTGVQLLTALITNLPTIINTIAEKMPEIIDSIVKSLTNMIPTIVETGVRLLTALIDNLPQILQTLVTATPLIIERIVNGLKDLLPMLVQTGVDLFVALIKNLPQAIVLIVQALPDIISAIVGGLGEFLPSLWQAGKDLIAGLWNGINNAKEWLREKISGFFGGVVDSIKAFFGIKSPSKLFAGIGEMLDRGLAKGVGDYADLAVDAAEEMANDVFDATDRDYDFTATGNVDDTTPAWRKNAPVINVYGAEGQDVNELAEIISERMAFTYSQEQAVWA